MLQFALVLDNEYGAQVACKVADHCCVCMCVRACLCLRVCEANLWLLKSCLCCKFVEYISGVIGYWGSDE